MTDPTPRPTAGRPTPGPRAATAGGRKRRPHPAARARIIAAGLAGTAAFGMVAGMALPHAGVAAAPSGPASASTPTDSRAATSTPAPVPATSLAPAPVTSSSGS